MRRSERIKERRNPSADAHGQPMSGGKPLLIVPSWAWAIRYRPSLIHGVAFTQGAAESVRRCPWSANEWRETASHCPLMGMGDQISPLLVSDPLLDFLIMRPACERGEMGERRWKRRTPARRGSPLTHTKLGLGVPRQPARPDSLAPGNAAMMAALPTG